MILTNIAKFRSFSSITRLTFSLFSRILVPQGVVDGGQGGVCYRQGRAATLTRLPFSGGASIKTWGCKRVQDPQIVISFDHFVQENTHFFLISLKFVAHWGQDKKAPLPTPGAATAPCLNLSPKDSFFTFCYHLIIPILELMLSWLNDPILRNKNALTEWSIS